MWLNMDLRKVFQRYTTYCWHWCEKWVYQPEVLLVASILIVIVIDLWEMSNEFRDRHGLWEGMRIQVSPTKPDWVSNDRLRDIDVHAARSNAHRLSECS